MDPVTVIALAIAALGGALVTLLGLRRREYTRHEIPDPPRPDTATTDELARVRRETERRLAETEAVHRSDDPHGAAAELGRVRLLWSADEEDTQP